VVDRGSLHPTVPVAAWALQSLGLALTTTQLDLFRGVSRVPFMLMYATTSVIVGVAILLLGLAYTKLLTTTPPFAQPRVMVLSAAAWAGAALAWATVIVRELALVSRA